MSVKAKSTHRRWIAAAAAVMNGVKEKLGLRDQQAEEVRTTLNSIRDEARPDLQALREARADLRRLLDRQDSDSAALRAAGDRVKALQGKLLDRGVEAHIAIRSKLTADQWSKWWSAGGR